MLSRLAGAFLCLGSLLSIAAASAGERLSIAPAPLTEPLSRQFKVRAEGRNVPVYVAKVRSGAAGLPYSTLEVGEAAFASFDAQGSVKVTVTVVSPLPIHTARILPTSYGLTPRISNGTITFVLPRPAQVTLEINGDWNNSLHLFDNPVEPPAPRKDDPNVIYFGPGVHVIPPLEVGSGKTIYIEDGAVLYGILGAQTKSGPVILLRGSHITLRGRGIIDGSLIPKPTGRGNILSVHGTDITVEGVILRDSSTWNLPVMESNNIRIGNVKMFGWRGNSDGIDIVNSQDVLVRDSFLRTYDDLVVVKTTQTGAQDSRNISVRHMVLWNELAHSLSLGAELRQNVENVEFADCDIIHDKGIGWNLRVYQSDSGWVRHVVFEDIRIEEDRRPFSLWIGKGRYSQDAERGHIDDVIFRNIRAAAPERAEDATQLQGFDVAHAVHGVVFDHVTLGSRNLTRGDIEPNEFVTAPVVTP
ncbi:MAG: hypothetical protein JWO52_6434 [Gammaproteobacteria bacterium]|nr:hypothetical protein [Gammaproteobacteria bacterium]